MWLSVALPLAGVAHAVHGTAAAASPSRPNIVFLVAESTDGRAWARDYQQGAVKLPNIFALQDAGVEFQSHYSNAPVCCPSRAAFWSGRHVHNIPHRQASSGLPVAGAWNNYEGLPANFSRRMDQVLEQEGYNVKMSGKFDWTTGGHSENVHLDAWTMYARYPYNLSESPGGWVEEGGCVDRGTVRPGRTPSPSDSAHKGDWQVLDSSVTWIKAEAAHDPRPFFVYQGMNIVHPPYVTSEYWFSTVDQSKVAVPEWQDLEDMHPCDFQSSMLKGCLPPPSSKEGAYFYSRAHRVRIRTIYLAMIAEFDAMVGRYVQAVKDTGRAGNTVFIVTSDHGDMQMEHRQYYKMVPYDASSRVPMVLMDGRRPRKNRLVTTAATQLIDIFPTVLAYAGVPKSRWPELDGAPMQALFDAGDGFAASALGGRPDFAVSQFHGDDIAMSWFLVVHGGLKLVVWGTGDMHPHQLFNLTADPDEMRNLAGVPTVQPTVKLLLGKLRSVVDFPAVARGVAKYGQDSLKHWVRATPHWRAAMGKRGLRWYGSWSRNAQGAIAAVEQFLAQTPGVAACRTEKVWPPPASASLII